MDLQLHATEVMFPKLETPGKYFERLSGYQYGVFERSTTRVEHAFMARRRMGTMKKVRSWVRKNNAEKHGIGIFMGTADFFPP